MALTFLRFEGVQHFRSICPEKANFLELGWEGGGDKDGVKIRLIQC